MRLYERLRLIAHHDLADGHPQTAITNVHRAIIELEKAKPNDQITLQSSQLELAGICLAANQPKQALDCYNKVGVDGPDAQGASGRNRLAAQAAAGKGFCFLKMNDMDKAAREFHQALELYRNRGSAVKTTVFPIDLCPSCCKWGLEQTARLLRNPQDSIDFKMIDNQPLPCECVTSRSILARSNPPGIPIGVTASGVADSDKSLTVSNGTTSGADPKSKDDANLQSSWSTLIQAGKRSLRNKEKEKAERFFKSAISLLHKHNDKGIRLLESLQNLSFFYLSHGRGSEALPYLKEEIDLQRERFGKDDVALVAPLCRYASACMRQGRLGTADEYMSESLKLSDRFMKDKGETSAIVHSNLSELRVAQMRFGEAEIHGQKALRIFETLNPLNKSRIGATNFTLARALIAQNKLAEAQSPMKESLKLLEINDTSAHMKVLLLITQADLAVRLKDLNSAKLAVRKAREIFNKIRFKPGVARPTKMTPIETHLLRLETVTGAATLK